MFKNRKLTRISLLVLGLLLVLVSAMYVVPRVLAATCFSDVNGTDWFEPYVCWLKNKGITSGYSDGTFRPYNAISRAEMAVMLRAAFTNASMVTYINTGPNNWVVNGNYTTSAYVKYYYIWNHLRSTSTGDFLYSFSPSLPSSLYNTKMYMKGVKMCIDGSDSLFAYITKVDLYHIYYTSSGGTVWNSLSSDVDLTTTGCYTYYFSSPSSFWGTDQVTLNVWGTFTNTGYVIRVGTVTLILQPSTELAVLGVDDAEAALLGRGDLFPSEYDSDTGAP